jgi:hypothetical protein
MASNAPTHIDDLPPEILQSIWRHLSFFDLLRCQQVCQKWVAYLPGNDSTLRQTLFSPLTRQYDRQPLYFDVLLEVHQHLEIQELNPVLPPHTTFDLCVYGFDKPWLRDTCF